MISTNIGMLKLLFVDDREEDLRPIRKLVEGKENMSFHHVDSVVEAKNEIKSTRPDIVIIDLKLSSQASDSNLEGKKVEDLIWDNHFCPVIIYSGYAEDYESSDTNQRRNHPLVKIVPKGRDSEDEVLNTIESFSQYSLAIQEVATDVWSARQEALRDAVPHILGESLHEESVENVKLTVKCRIASMMDKPISGDTPLAAQTQYLIPPIDNNVILGDILKKRKADSEDPTSFQVVLTPSCDMVDSGERKAKISNVLVAKCDSLKTLLKSTGMGEGRTNEKWKSRIRSHVLTPGFLRP